MVEVQANFTWGVENEVLGRIGPVNPGNLLNLAGLAASVGGAVASARQFIDPYTSLMSRFSTSPVPPFVNVAIPNPSPENSNNTRGTLLEHVVAQALSGPCEVPAAPTLEESLTGFSGVGPATPASPAVRRVLENAVIREQVV